MIYLLYGLNSYLINDKINKIIKDKKIDNININRYNLETTKIDNIIEDANTYSLFDNNKIIIVDNAYIFTGMTIKNDIEQNIDNLINYINNYNQNTILIFNIIAEKLDERKKIVKLLKEKKMLIELNNIDTKKIVRDMFNDYKIDLTNINFLINRVGDNLDKLSQEINKLKLYKYDEKIITKEDIINCTNEEIDLDIFKFIDDIVNKNKKSAIIKYKEFLKRGEEPIKIIIMLANQFRIMYQVKSLSINGYSEKDISSTLEIHPYRVKMALEKSRSYKKETIINYIKKLSDLDINIKSGVVNDKLGLELFILNV